MRLRDRLPLLITGTRRRAERDLARVPDRVAALSRFVSLAGPHLPPSIMDHPTGVVERAGGRLALAGAHTIVALAGTTGSGKSSLFNALAGAPLSPAGLRRPTTGIAHAAVYTTAADPIARVAESGGTLLDWLGVDVRSGVDADPALDGLVLLDLPDIDSVQRGHGVEADRLLALVDLVVWVLDPQKYADATVHRRYRETFAHHADITVVALNQADRLGPADRRRCLDDLAGLLHRDGLGGVPVLATSTVDEPGINALHSVLASAVAARVMFLRRVGADIDDAVARVQPVMAPDPVPLDDAGQPLVQTLAGAAGVTEVTAAARSSYVHRAVRHTGWPVTRWLRRLRGDPLRRLRLGRAHSAERDGPIGVTAVPPASPAARARVTLATRALGDAAGWGLAQPWAEAFRAAARSRAADVGDALDRAVAVTDLGQDRTPAWWRVVGVGQWLLLATALAGLVWLVARWALAALALPGLWLPTVGVLPWPTLLLVVGVLGGLALAAASRVAVRVAARRHADRVRARLTRSVAGVADELVLAPVVRVRDDYRAAQTALADAARP